MGISLKLLMSRYVVPVNVNINPAVSTNRTHPNQLYFGSVAVYTRCKNNTDIWLRFVSAPRVTDLLHASCHGDEMLFSGVCSD